MILMTAAFCAFTLTAVLGLMIAFNLFRGKFVARSSSILHGASALLGSVLAIGAALLGETAIYINIVMAVVIIALGVLAAIKRHKTGIAPKGILLVHILLAVTCYLMLGATVFLGIDTAGLLGINLA